MRGDEGKVVAAMMEITRPEHPPRRQLLGSDAYAMLRDALTQRLEDVEEQRKIAFTTDVDSSHAVR